MAEMHSQARAFSPYELVPNFLRYTFNVHLKTCNCNMRLNMIWLSDLAPHVFFYYRN